MVSESVRNWPPTVLGPAPGSVSIYPPLGRHLVEEPSTARRPVAEFDWNVASSR